MSPADPDRFARDLADAVNRVMADADLRRRMGVAGRRRAVERFSWAAIAEQTVELYRSLAGPG
jgi:starch synthase